MPELLTTVGPWRAPTFTLALMLAAFAAYAVLVTRRRDLSPGAAADVLLMVLIGAALGARLGYVALHGAEFAAQPAEIFRLKAGGLNAETAVVGALVGLLIAARWRSLNPLRLLDAAALPLAIAVGAGWYGCAAAACGFGREVDTLARYPALLVVESRDVYGMIAPRFNTPFFGLLLAALMLVAGLALWRKVTRPGQQFGALWMMLSGGLFLIGFWRADAADTLGGLRPDQWLNLLSLGAGLLLVLLAPPLNQQRA